MKRTLCALTIMGLATALAAQTGTYTNFGAGCKGTGGTGNFCIGENMNGGTPWNTHNQNIFALPFTPKTTTVLFGFELFTKSTTPTPVTIKTEVYAADAAGKPTGTPIKTGTMVIGPVATFWRTSFTPLIAQANTKYFISYQPTPNMHFPIILPGTNSIHYWHSPTTTAWNGPFTSVAWSWRLVCAGGSGAAPVLSNTGVPTIAQSFSIDLAKAKANTAALLSLGGSTSQWGAFKLPLDLTAAGAPGCSLLASLDLVFAAASSGAGAASLKFPVPNATGLIGVVFHNQWIVVDPGANSFGLAFSAGGTGKIGK